MHIFCIFFSGSFSPYFQNDTSPFSWSWMHWTHLARVIFFSASTLYDTDVGWLLNTLLCMFYEYDDYSNSTSEPVVCQWSQRMYTLPRLPQRDTEGEFKKICPFFFFFFLPLQSFRLRAWRDLVLHRCRYVQALLSFKWSHNYEILEIIIV